MVYHRTVVLTMVVAVTMAAVTSGEFDQKYPLILTATWNLHSFNHSNVIVQERRNISHAFTENPYQWFYRCLTSSLSTYCATISIQTPSKGDDFLEVKTVKETSGWLQYIKYNYQCRSPDLSTIACYRLDDELDVCARGLRGRRLFQFFDMDSKFVSLYWTEENPIYIGGEGSELGVHNDECNLKSRGLSTSSSLAMVILALMVPIYEMYLLYLA